MGRLYGSDRIDVPHRRWIPTAPPTVVGKDLGLVWDVRAALGDPLQFVWDVRAALGDTVQLVWDVRAALGDTVQLVWDVRAAVGDPVQLVWDVRAALGDTIQLVWNIETLSTAVGKDLALVWDVRTAAGDALVLVWNVAVNQFYFMVPSRGRRVPYFDPQFPDTNTTPLRQMVGINPRPPNLWIWPDGSGHEDELPPGGYTPDTPIYYGGARYGPLTQRQVDQLATAGYAGFITTDPNMEPAP